MVDTGSRLRFWFGIALASVFGTNMGDFVAGFLHLGHVRGLPPLAALFALLLVAARFGKRDRDGGMAEPLFWTAIAVLRTGATNIADFADHQEHLGPALLVPVLAVLMLVLALYDRRRCAERGPLLLRLGASYWSTMLVAGVLGTVAGDAAEDLLGDRGACAFLLLLLAPCLAARCVGRSTGTGWYWLVVALARTFGTALGDTLADRGGVGLGVPLSTFCTLLLFAGLLLCWRPRGRAVVSPAAPATVLYGAP